MADAGELKRLPLEDLHVAAGARFGGFAGWHMPITYPAGVMKEHLHTREKAGLFDISHMKLFRVEGPGAADMLSRACPIDAVALEQTQSKLTFFLDEKAGILDDLIVTRLAPHAFMVVANAGNADADERHLKDIAKGFDCTVDPLDGVFLAIQGPASESILRHSGLDLSKLTFMHGIEQRQGWFASRSGYTGEDGFEIALPAADARELAAKLLSDDRLMWIGLAARDSLRLEAGLCLHGNDISPDTDPATAALMWAISKPVREAALYIGATALAEIVARGPAQKRVGLKPEGRQPVRGGDLFDEAGALVGRVTSGGFGPSAGHPVAMGYVRADLAKPGTRVFAEVRGARVPIDVATLPFTHHRHRKG